MSLLIISTFLWMGCNIKEEPKPFRSIYLPWTLDSGEVPIPEIPYSAEYDVYIPSAEDVD